MADDQGWGDMGYYGHPVLRTPNFFDNDPILSREGIAVQTHGESSMVTAEAAIKAIFTKEGFVYLPY